jgi:hypothetical protein
MTERALLITTPLYKEVLACSAVISSARLHVSTAAGPKKEELNDLIEELEVMYQALDDLYLDIYYTYGPEQENLATIIIAITLPIGFICICCISCLCYKAQQRRAKKLAS